MVHDTPKLLQFTASNIPPAMLKEFTTIKMSHLLADMKRLTLTLETLMAAQYQCATVLAEVSGDELLSDIANGLSQYQHAKLAIDIIGVSEKEYFTRDPGLSEEQYTAVKNGMLTVGDMIQLKPEIFLAPVIRPTRLPH